MPRFWIVTALAFAAGALHLASCRTPATFQCQADAQCDNGVCAEGGFCGFPDDDCPSGVRYGEFATDDLAGTCTPPVVGTTTDVAASGEDEGPRRDTTSDGDATTFAVDDSTESESTESTLPPPCEQWWDTAWPSRRALTADAPALRETVSNFPVPVRLGEDIVVGSASEVVFVGDRCTVIPHEIETSMRGGALIAWVRFPAVGPDAAPIHVYYGNRDDPDPLNSTAVWDLDFAGVWHLAGGGNSVSTRHELLTPQLGAVGGPLGDAVFFDGVDDTTQASASTLAASTATAVSISLWARFDGLATPATKRIVDKADALDATLGFSLSVVQSTDLSVEISFDRGRAMGEFAVRTVDAPIEIGAWHHIAAAHESDADMATITVDGTPLQTTLLAAGLGEPASDDDVPLTIGSTPYATNRFFPGAIDDVRLSVVARPASWFLAEYLAGTGALLTVGDAEASP
ncbi:MAG: hypothetical protein JKY37_16705 [Nannocystaceae bacterium]|nr:hypothetical protein [Nannocystaceae bacterium]